jgi:hypothetical protein
MGTMDAEVVLAVDVAVAVVAMQLRVTAVVAALVHAVSLIRALATKHSSKI